jgi:TonB family protein
MKSATLLAAVLPLLLARPAGAQTILLSRVDGQIGPVDRVVGVVPYALISGSLKSTLGSGLFLHKAPYFHSGPVRVEEFKMTTRWLEADGSELNAEMTLVGYLTASETLDNCYLAFEMLDENGRTRQIGTIALPRLVAGAKQPLRALLKLAGKPEEGRYRIHIFADRLECLTSLMGSNYVFGKTTAGDLAGSAGRDPAPLLGVAPVYPRNLVAQAIPGDARIACLVGPDGDVREASVQQADRPEFGEAALAALKQWLFVPAVKDHHYVAERIVVPFHFRAPGAPST